MKTRTEGMKIMTIMNNIKLVLGIISILLAIYSFLGFVRLARFWYRISNLERFQELFLYISVFVAAFIVTTMLLTIMGAI